MNRLWLLLLAGVLGLSGCARVEQATTQVKKPPELSNAVLLALNDFFSGTPSVGKIYIEAGPHVRNDMRQVGRYEAEVISEAGLQQRFAGEKTAPAFARVRAQVNRERGRNLYIVEINYTALHVPGADEIPLGGGEEYRYEAREGELVLVGKDGWVE